MPMPQPANFLIDSPEVQDWIDDVNSIFKANKLKKNTLTVVPGGADAIKQLISGNNNLGNLVLDAIGGVGQYKLPQRLGAAALGGVLLGNEDSPISAAGAIGGYGIGAGLEQAVRHMRNSDLDSSLKQIQDSGALTNLDEAGFMAKLRQVSEALKAGDLSDALSANDDLLESGKSPFGTMTQKSYARGVNLAKSQVATDLLDNNALANLTASAPKEISKMRELPGFAKREYASQIKSLLAHLQSTADTYAPAGISGQSLRDSGVNKSMQTHELSELLHVIDPELKNRLPMEGGEFGKSVSGETGLRSLGAAHQSPGVILQESNMNARILGPEGKVLRDKMRAATGEKAFINKILGTSLDDVLLSNKYIADNSDDIAKILNAFKANKMPEKQILDKVRVNSLASIMGKAGRGISNFEHSLAQALKTLLKK